MSRAAWKRGYKRTDFAVYLLFAVYAIVGCSVGASDWILLPDFSSDDAVYSLLALMVATGLVVFGVLRLFVLKLTPWVISGYREDINQSASVDLTRVQVKTLPETSRQISEPSAATAQSTAEARDFAPIDFDNIPSPVRAAGGNRLFFFATAASVLVTVALICLVSSISGDSIAFRLGFLGGSSVLIMIASAVVGRLFRNRAPVVGQIAFAVLFFVFGAAMSANIIREARQARAASTQMANSLQELVSGNAITPVTSSVSGNDPAARLARYSAAYVQLLQDDQSTYATQVASLVGIDPVAATTLSDVATMRARLPGLVRAAQLSDSLLLRLDQRQADYLAGLPAAVRNEQLVQETIRGFRQGAAKTRSCAEAIAAANRSYYEDIYGIYRLLIANEGHYQFSGEQIVIDDPSVLSEFNAYVDDINLRMRISQEQYNLWTGMAQEQINVMRDLP